MTGAWSFAGEPAPVGSGGVTLVEGSTFCISDHSGDVAGDAPRGLFFRDTRILSTWVLTVDGERLLPMTCHVAEPFAAAFVTRALPRTGTADSTLLVVRHRAVGNGMHERLTLQNLSPDPVAVEVGLDVGADFADLFAVKEARVSDAPGASAVVDDDGTLHLLPASGPDQPHRAVAISAHPAGTVTAGRFAWREDLAPRETRTIDLTVSPTIGEETLSPRHAADLAGEGTPHARMREWRRTSTVVTSRSRSLDRTIARSVVDLGALRIFDPAHPRRAVVAAGAPWFMAVFGRDSLLTAWMLLPLDRQLALGTLQTLADRQGRRVDPATDEQPGRILHEVRFGPQAALWLGGKNVYYGSVDATPLFVMLVGELRRWGTAWADIAPLLPHVDRALDWITGYGDRDGDGFVEYERLGPLGLEHQGWKDSFDAVTFADGRPARTPIALAEVQGYVYAAYRTRAALAREAGEEPRGRIWDDAADALKHRFNETFWLPEQGAFALALDAEKRPVDAIASNMGHCLWTGIVDDDKAGAVAARLMSDEMFSGWGVRTLGTSAAAYNPMSYHNGSVWPHDNAIVAAGLARYGFAADAARIAEAQLEVADRLGGRLPELFCGFDRAQFDNPVPYPAACSPQAWASGAPFLLLRALLGLEPDVPGGVLRLTPAMPGSLLPITVENVLLDTLRAEIRVDAGSHAHVRGAPPWLRVESSAVAEPQPRI